MEAGSRKQEAGVGSYFTPGAEARLFLSQISKRYIDRDDGLDKISTGGSDVSDKYSYTSIGYELNYEFEANKQWDFKVGLALEELDFKKPPAGSEYDHSYSEFFAKVNFLPAKGNKIKAKLSQYTRSYDTREARDLNGSTLGARPALEYVYTDISVEWRHRFDKRLVTYIAYAINDREDQDVGYNDRTKNTISARALYKINPKLKAKIKLSRSNYDYANAWAYDTNLSGLKKTYDSTYITGNAEYEIKKDFLLDANVRVYNTNTNDTRYDYERNIITVSITHKR